MNEQQFKDRTKMLALEVIKLVDELPRGRTTDILTGQLARAATSVASNYRAACRAKSTADLISKLGNVEEESDETGFWLEMLVDAKKVAMNRVPHFELFLCTLASPSRRFCSPPPTSSNSIDDGASQSLLGSSNVCLGRPTISRFDKAAEIGIRQHQQRGVHTWQRTESPSTTNL